MLSENHFRFHFHSSRVRKKEKEKNDSLRILCVTFLLKARQTFNFYLQSISSSLLLMLMLMMAASHLHVFPIGLEEQLLILISLKVRKVLRRTTNTIVPPTSWYTIPSLGGLIVSDYSPHSSDGIQTHARSTWNLKPLLLYKLSALPMLINFVDHSGTGESTHGSIYKSLQYFYEPRLTKLKSSVGSTTIEWSW